MPTHVKKYNFVLDIIYTFIFYFVHGYLCQKKNYVK